MNLNDQYYAGIRLNARQADPKVLICIWEGLTHSLDRWRTDWRVLVDQPGAALAVTDLLAPPPKTNRQIFEAFAVALLSGNTRWDRIARIRHELKLPFENYDPHLFAALTDDHLDRSIVPWFRERRAGAAGLSAALLRLRSTARMLAEHDPSAASAHNYLRDAAKASDGTAEGLAITLGTSKYWKLPGFGVVLAAEALRLLGLDVCKPDRHILRAVAAWALVDFQRWDRTGHFSSPDANTVELRDTMLAVRAVAMANKVSVSHANSAIWTAGAVSGARLINEQLEAIRENCAGPS